MRIADIQPLFVSKLLVPRGSLVFSVLHPCFNNPYSVQMAELMDHEGTFATTYSVKQSRYLTPGTRLGAAMHGQPVPHPYFHRPLSALLGAGFNAGFVLDGLEERAFPVDRGGGTTPLSWGGNFSENSPRARCSVKARSGTREHQQPLQPRRHREDELVAINNPYKAFIGVAGAQGTKQGLHAGPALRAFVQVWP